MTSTEVSFDWAREARTVIPEAVFCEGKSIEQLLSIAAAAEARESTVLFTRLDPDKAKGLPSHLDYDPVSRTGILGAVREPTAPVVAVVTAGSSDIPVAREAARALTCFGYGSTLIADVGVAGLWRLLDQIDVIRRHKVVIAVAGMEGALFSVLAGLVTAPVIAVPTSIGYGVSAGGRAALHSALATCAPGVLTVNIDNGYGAAAAAGKILRTFSS